MRRRALLPVTLLTALLGMVAIAGCGSDEPAESSASAPPVLPFPPKAAEPPATRAGAGDDPEGLVRRVGGQPEGIAVDPDSGLLGVATDGPTHAFALVDPTTLAVRRTVPLPSNARHVQAGPRGQFLVPLEDADQLAVVPATGGAPRILKAGDQPHDAAAVGDDLVVGDEFGGTATVLRDGRRRATVPVDVQPGGVAAVGDRTAAIVSVRANTVALLDLRTLVLGPSQNAGYGPSHVVAAPDGRLFIADTRGDAVLEFATRPRLKALHRLDGTGAAYGLAIDGERGRLWVTDVRGARLLLVDVSGSGAPRITRSWRTVAQPNSVAVDPASGAAIVAGARGGLLQRVAP